MNLTFSKLVHTYSILGKNMLILLKYVVFLISLKNFFKICYVSILSSFIEENWMYIE